MDSDCLSHLLKIWSDRYKISGEIKGGKVALNYSVFIVTSNWSISELFKDPKVHKPIERRFLQWCADPDINKDWRLDLDNRIPHY